MEPSPDKPQEPKRPQEPLETPGPRWERTQKGSLQTGKVRVDPAADWYFANTDGRWSPRAPVLIGLRPGVAPRALRNPPPARDAKPISPKEWRENLLVSPAFLAGKADDVLQRAGYCSGFATRRFFEWLVENPDLQRVVQSIALSAAPASDTRSLKPFKLMGAPRKASVVLGVIDDWIGVANHRFRLAGGGTRCLSLWLQGVNGQSSQAGSVPYGRALDETGLNALLAASGGDEEAFERSLYPPGKALPSGRLTHGTHVADLFAGYGHTPAAEATLGKDRPMIAVALPRPVVRDTSGLTMTKPVMDAIVHIIRTVRPLNGSPPVMAPGGDAPPIVINFSFGFMADLGYQMSDLREWITRLMDAYNQAHPKAPLAFVTAAGNGFQSQTCACLPRVGVPKAKKWGLDLKVLPDDRTPSYINIELPRQANNYSLTISAPGVPAVTVNLANTLATLALPGGPPMAIAQFDPPSSVRPAGIFSLAINATAEPLDGSVAGGLAPHGLWRLALSGPGTASNAPAYAFVARDQAVLGAPTFGRQARFEDPAYEKYDRFGRPGRTDKPDSAVRRGGCINILGREPAGGPVSVAADILSTLRPADYSAGGAPLNGTPPLDIRAPDVISDAEHSEVVMGLLAAGTRTGSVAAMNGTSVAAPLVARRIADAMAAHAPGASGGTANVGRELAYELAVPPLPQPMPLWPKSARHGHGRIPASGARTLRLTELRNR